MQLLFHGTTRGRLAAIARGGLRPGQTPRPDGHLVLTASMAEARAQACAAWRADNPGRDLDFRVFEEELAILRVPASMIDVRHDRTLDVYEAPFAPARDLEAMIGLDGPWKAVLQPA